MTEERKPHGNIGNKHAKKGNDPADSFLHIRCTKPDKSAWVRAAKPGKLSDWVIKSLNQAAKNEEKP